MKETERTIEEIKKPAIQPHWNQKSTICIELKLNNTGLKKTDAGGPG